MENVPPPGSGTADPNNRLYAIVAYVPFLCFISLFGKESSDFTRHHGRQGLLLLVLEIIALIMLSPIGKYLWISVLLICLVVAAAGVASAFSGKDFSLPYIGHWADKL